MVDSYKQIKSKFINIYKNTSISCKTKLNRIIKTNIELIVMSIIAASLVATQIGVIAWLYFIIPICIMGGNIINANKKLKGIKKII